MYDCIIIGKGPAGISAAIYISRSNLKTLVIGKENTALNRAKSIENYYGFEDSISGEELFKNGINQAKKQNIEMKNDEVIDIEYGNGTYIVKTVNSEYETRTIVLATGKSRKTSNIEGETTFEGKGISYCAICDGFFFKGKNVAVIGNGEYALHEAEVLKNVTDKVTIFTNGSKLPENRSLSIQNIIEGRIDSIKGNTKVEEILLEDKRSIPVDGIFIAQGIASSADFAKKLGILLKNNDIIVNENMETNVPGIYAAGDCTGGLLQICKAVYEGAKCGLSIAKKIKNI
ncbi:MAG: NAD(P)/FAD-dependent oxidoreductase [Clostridia bacterium]|jgi:putative thioredoxin-disulfide reductase|nr:FAD-dependent oxidoreductase [Clostridium sp.]